MASKGIIYPSKEIPSKIELALRPGGGAVKYALVKDRELYKTLTVSNGTTSLEYFVDNPGPLNLDSYEKAKTLFAIPNAAVVFGIAAYHRRKLTTAEWEDIYYNGAYQMQIQLGGEFITVDKGVLAQIAGGAHHQPSIAAAGGAALTELVENNAYSDFRWYAVPQNKTVPPGENFQLIVTFPTPPSVLASPVRLTIALYAGEYKPIGQ